MKISDDTKKNIIRSFIETVTWIASKEYQRRVWINAIGPEVNDFDETCNFFFEDCEIIIENYNEFGISENQYKLLVKFRDDFENFSDDNNWPLLFIDTPEWTRITKMAEEVLQAFNYKERRK